MRPVIILFAKAPVAGRVKTRLQPPLSPAEAAGLHAAFVADAIDSLQSLTALADLELHTDTPTDAWPGAAVNRRLQTDGDLGQRMLHALDQALSAGRPRAVIVGSDAPTLPLTHLEAVLRSPADVILGPTEDGGYYAIGCRRTHPRMFDGVAWSAAETLEQTRRAAETCGLTVALAPPWFDVDSEADLDRLLAAIEKSAAPPRATMAWLMKHAGKESRT